MKLIYSSNIDQNLLKNSAIEKLNETLKEAAGKSVLLLLSGGSALELLDGIDVSSLNSNVTISVLDERYSTNPAENNFAQVVATEFYKSAQSRGVNFIDTRILNNETKEELAKRFNSSLVDWFKNNPNRTVVATIGMGPDGHASGIMPFPEDPDKFKSMFDNEKVDDFITAYDATGKNQYTKRVSTNMNLLRKINVAIAYITGENKRDALEKVKAENGSLAPTPARILREIKGNVFVYTDIV